MASKLDLIMDGFGISKEPTDTSKDISEQAEKESNNIKVKKATLEEVDETTTEEIENVVDEN